jgi:hypothetical protein
MTNQAEDGLPEHVRANREAWDRLAAGVRRPRAARLGTACTGLGHLVELGCGPPALIGAVATAGLDDVHYMIRFAASTAFGRLPSRIARGNDLLATVHEHAMNTPVDREAVEPGPGLPSTAMCAI